MALKKIIKVEDPDDIKSGYAGKVMESVKFAALIASFTGFVVGIISEDPVDGIRFRFLELGCLYACDFLHRPLPRSLVHREGPPGALPREDEL